MLENSHTKRPSHKLRETEICERFQEIHRKQATDEGAQNATPVEEMPCNHSKSDPLNATQALKMQPPARKRYVTAQKTLRRRFPSKKPHLGKRHLGAQKTIPVDEIAPACSECDHCRINCICVSVYLCCYWVPVWLCVATVSQSGSVLLVSPSLAMCCY